ncbi:D-alanyl-D-alanine carboxypeptidase family protein [Parablautia muri]|nr:D-alanyl-D-alanine carboxypeptidase family protein [Parablautia muri]
MKPIGKTLMKITALLLSLLLFPNLLVPLAVYANEEDTPDFSLYAQSAVLMDAASGRILYEKDGQKVMPMASTTKIMTCILALENGNPEDYAIASSYAASMPKVKLYVKEGEYYRLKDLLYSLMLESHNDAAVVIAEHIAGSTQSFADMMNQKAKEIGCHDTFFITPNGLDATATAKDGTVRVHSTTAADLARIMSYCIMDSPKKEDFLAITRTPSYSFENYRETDGQFVGGGRTFQCNNHNAFLSMMDGALSGKTGFTGTAGYCYVGALRKDNRTYVVALLACGWPNNKTYKWSDTKTLMNYGLDHFEYHSLSEAAFDESQLKPIKVLNGQTDRLGATAYVDVEIARPLETAPSSENGEHTDNAPSADDGILLKKDESIQVDFQAATELTAPIEAGTQVGTIRYLVDETVYKIEYIFTSQSVPAIDFSWCLSQILQRYTL